VTHPRRLRAWLILQHPLGDDPNLDRGFMIRLCNGVVLTYQQELSDSQHGEMIAECGASSSSVRCLRTRGWPLSEFTL